MASAITPATLENELKLTNMRNVMRPCSACYKARQFVSDQAGRLIRRKATHTEVTTRAGLFLVENKGHTIVAVPNFALHQFIGRRVTFDAGYMIDVNTTARLWKFSVRRKLTIPPEEP